jgi:hypothetical protein
MQYIAKFLTYVVAVGLSKYMPKKMTSNVTGLWVLGTISFLLVVSGMGTGIYLCLQGKGLEDYLLGVFCILSTGCVWLILQSLISGWRIDLKSEEDRR